MTRLLNRSVSYGLIALSLLVVQSCADVGRGPTTPSAVAVPALSMNWACLRQTASTNETSDGWTFPTPAADCPATPAAPDIAVGMVTAPPGNLRSTVTGTTVRLDWNGLSEAVTSFLIEAGSAPTLANLARLNTGNAALAFVVNNVPAGEYYVRVRAIGPDGVSGPASNEIVVRVGGGSAGQLPPSGLRAEVAGNQVNLFWSAPDGESPGSYVVEAGSAPALSNVVVFDTGTPATQLVAVAPDGNYYVRIRTQRNGPASNEVLVVVPGNGCTYSLSTTRVQIAPGGGRFEVNVSVSAANCTWSADAEAAFVNLTSNNAVIGNGSASFSVGANGTGQARQGVVRIAGQAVTVSQDAATSEPAPPPPPPPPPPTCVYSVSPTSVELQATGGDFEVAVTTPGCTFSASSSIATVVQATVPTAARFRVSANTGTNRRDGQARISWTGGEQIVSISQVAPQTGGGGGEDIDDNVTPPTDPPSTRIAEQPPAARPCSSSNPAAGCVTLQSVQTEAAAPTPACPNCLTTRFSASGLFNRVIAAEGTSTGGAAPLAPSYRIYTFSSLRTSAEITVAVTATQPFTASFAVTRDALLPANYVSTPISPPCTYSLTPPASPLPSGAGTFEVAVTASSPTCSWSTSATPSFATVIAGSGTGSGTARFSYAANSSTTSRSGTLTIGGRSITITQAGICNLSVTPTSVPMTFTGGQFSLTITAGCSWTATPQQSFITVVTGAGSGNGTATFNVAQLISPNPRSGVVRITWSGGFVDVSVNQSPPPCFYGTSTSRSFTGVAQTFSVPITVTAQPPFTPTTCASWSATSQSSFMTVPNPGPFSGSGQTSVNLAANDTGSTRTGTIRVSFGGSFFDITVTQSPAPNSTPRITSGTCTNPPTGPGGTISCPGTAIDDNPADVITWTPTASHTCTWFSVQPYTPSNPLSVTMRGTVPAGFSGTCNINFAVCDPHGACTSWTGFHTWNPALVENERTDRLHDVPVETRRGIDKH